MKHFLTLYIVLIISFGFSQTNWIKDNAVWHYNYTNISSGWIKVWDAGDTVIQSKTCTKLRSKKHEFFITGPGGGQMETESGYINGYVYFQNDTVFYWDVDHFSVLYDFTATQGESWILHRGGNPDFGCNDTSRCIVSNVDNVLINGTNYTQWEITPAADAACQISGLVNARFGASGGYVLPFGRSCDGTIVEFDQIQFTCFQDDSLFYNPSGNTCEYYLGIDDQEKSSIVVYPNPASDKLEILSDRGIQTIYILDVFGKTVKTLPSGYSMQSVDVSMLSPGSYFLQIETLEGERIMHSFQIASK